LIELWHEWTSVHSFKVRVALAEKGLAWTGHRLQLLRFEHLHPEYLRLNPNGVVPTLVHDGRLILESSVICQYLDETFPSPPLLPAHPYPRAQARTWLKYFDEAAHPALRRLSFERMYRAALSRMPQAELEASLRAHPDQARAEAFRRAAANPQPDAAVISAATAECARIATRIEAALPSADWLGGEAFGMTDVALAPFVERLDTLDMNELWRTPAGRAWSARILARASVKASRTPPEHRMAVA
jgi:glutathione S-transferase